MNPLPKSQTARFLLIFLLDTSGSMAGKRIQQLNESLLTFSNDLRKNKFTSTHLDISIITFGDNVTVLPPESSDDFQPPNLFAGGATPLGTAVNKALDVIKEWKESRKNHGESFYRPLVILITDGEPTDDWQLAAANVRDEESRKALNFLSVGIEGANLEVLSNFSRKNKPLPLKETDFGNLFAWTSQSVSVVANAEAGQKVITQPITWVESPPPPIYFYTELETPTVFETKTVQSQIVLTPAIEHRITPEYLSAVISPYLNAIADLKHIVDDIQKRDFTEIFIVSITQNSPIGVSLEGVSDVLRLIVEIFDKGKRDRSKKMEEYILLEKRLELERKRLEHQEMNLRLAKEAEELRKLKIENTKAQFELEREITQMSIDIVEKVSPQLSESDKMTYVGRLLKPVGVLITSGLDITVRE